MSTDQLLLGLMLGIVFSFAAYLTRHLTWSGALMAALIGGLTFGFGGLVPAILLVLFFVSSSTLSRVGAARKQALGAAFAKGGRRDHGQVLANGGLPSVFAVLYGIFGQVLWLIALIGALAAATADTWATEIGVLARSHPRLITSGKQVEPGTSGAVTSEGTLAAVGGAGLIGLMVGFLQDNWRLVPPALVGGLVGSLIDSLLGATVQSIYHCLVCDKETEQHPHHGCGAETQRLRGWRWLGNDGVNFVASLVGAAVAIGVWSIA